MIGNLALVLGGTTLAATLALPVPAAAGPRPPRCYVGYSGHGLRHWSAPYTSGFGLPYCPDVFFGPGPGLGVYGSGRFNDYGPFTGARHDEENLLHLGGAGPYTGTPDLLTLIQSRGFGGYWDP